MGKEISKEEMKELIKDFIKDSLKEIYNTHEIHQRYKNLSYKNLQIKVSFGFGVPAKVSWIAFLGFNQEVSKGIYPVILFDRKNCLILAYGVSKGNKPEINWNPYVKNKYAKIEDSSCECNLNKINEKYPNSYLRKCYKLENGKLNQEQLENLIKNLDEIINSYSEVFKFEYKHTESEKFSSEISIEQPSSSYKKSNEQRNCLNSSGLNFKPHIITSFYNSLKTKGFVILAGLSGTGKTKIFEEFVKCLPATYKQELIDEKWKIENENIADLKRLLEEFKERYNENFLKNMRLQDWHDTKQGLAYELEHGKYKVFGGIIGSTADKFGIYKSKSGCKSSSNSQKGYCFKKSLGKNLDEAFKNLKHELIKLRKFAINGNLESIENEIHAISNLVKRKLAFLWNPNLIFNIYSDNHIKLIVKSFNKNCERFIDCQKILLEIKRKFFPKIDRLLFTKLFYQENIRALWEQQKSLINQKKISNNLFLPIRPDFKDTKSLLGFYNPLKDKYNSTPLLDFIIEASKNYLEKGNKADPFFILFDEMNLSRVEYYFADFLSVLEANRFKSKNEAEKDEIFKNFMTCLGFDSINEYNYKFTSKSMKLHNEENIDDIPKELFLPPNLYFVGTVNIDETTHMFSPKVLDRAFTIEFDMGSFNEYLEFLNTNSENLELPEEIKEQLKQDFINKGKFVIIDKEKIKEFAEENEKIVEKLEEINQVLKRYNLHFGYRVFDEIIMFLYNCQNSQYKFESLDEAFDLAIKMKVLPKFHGIRQKLEEAIIEFLRVLEIQNEELGDNSNNQRKDIAKEISEKLAGIPFIKDNALNIKLEEKEIAIKTNYLFTAHKLLEILYKLKTQGFASFM